MICLIFLIVKLNCTFFSVHLQPLNTLFLQLFVAQPDFATASVNEILRYMTGPTQINAESVCVYVYISLLFEQGSL